MLKFKTVHCVVFMVYSNDCTLNTFFEQLLHYKLQSIITLYITFTASENKTMTNKTYLETDMDNGRSRDLGKERFLSERDPRYSTSPYERKEEIHYASIKKDRPRDSLLRDRSKSEPPELRPDDPWHHSIDNTDVKMRVESGIEERHAKPEYASIKREPRREIREESLQKSSVTREVRQNVYHQSPRMPDQPDRVDGLYRAEMRMVTPEPSDQHRYQINQPHSMSSQDNSSREELLGDRRGNQVRVDVDVYNVVQGSGEEVNVSTDRVSDYVRTLNTPEAEEQRSFDILHDAQFSLNSDIVSGVKDSLGERSVQGGRSSDDGVLTPGDGSSRDMHVVSSSSTTNNKHQVVSSSRTNTKLVHMQSSRSDKLDTHTREGHGQQHSHHKTNTPAAHGITSVKITAKHSLGSSTVQEQQSPGGSSHQSLDGSVSQYMTRDQRQKHDRIHSRVQRMDSHAKRLTSDLAMSLLAGKEEVIRRALKRVSSDASNASDIKVHLRRKEAKLKPLDEYIASLNMSSTSHRGVTDTSPHSLGYSSHVLDTSATRQVKPSPPVRDASFIGLRRLGSRDESQQIVSSAQPLSTSTSAVSRLSLSGSASVSVGSPRSPSSPQSTQRMESTSVRSTTNPSLVGQHVASKLTTITSKHRMYDSAHSHTQTNLLQDSDRRAYGQTRTSAAHNYPYSTKPMSEVHPQQQVYVQKVKEPVFNQQVNHALLLCKITPLVNIQVLLACTYLDITLSFYVFIWFEFFVSFH